MCLGLGASKWGSHLGLGPLFLTDVLLGCAAARIAPMGLGARLRGGPGPRPSLRVPATLALFVGYCSVRMLVGDHYSLTAVRDFVPYGYAIIAVLIGIRLPSASAGDRERSVALIDRALVFHLCWVTVAALVPSVVDSAPQLAAFGGVQVFRVRTDIDMAILGLTGALYLWRAATVGGRRYIAGITWCVGLGATMNSRAGFISMVFSLGVTYLLVTLRQPLVVRRRLGLVALAPLILAAVILVLPLTVGGSKLTAGLGLTTPKSTTDQNGINTARGRSEAWSDVTAWTAEQHAQVFGVGFGPNFLADAGALAPLGGDPALRSPHNYFIGTYARLGGFGVGLFVLLLVRLARDAVTVTREPLDELGLLATLAPFALVWTAAFGVILESPFGAVPFFWFAGVLMTDARRLRAGQLDRAGRRRSPVEDRVPVLSAA